MNELIGGIAPTGIDEVINSKNCSHSENFPINLPTIFDDTSLDFFGGQPGSPSSRGSHNPLFNSCQSQARGATDRHCAAFSPFVPGTRLLQTAVSDGVFLGTLGTKMGTQPSGALDYGR